MSKINDFVHLRLHTEFSIQDGLVKINDLIAAAKAHNQFAVAITDINNLFSMVKFYQAAVNAGIKPVFGADIFLQANDEPDSPVYPMTLLCQNNIGYKNLCCLLTKSYQQGQHKNTVITKKQWLKQYANGIIALSGAEHGEIGIQILNQENILLEKSIKFWQTHFKDRFYLEICRTAKPEQEIYIQKVVEIAQKYNLPLVATNDVRFLKKDDMYAHEARVCIANSDILADKNRTKRYTSAQYFASTEEMLKQFQDIPEACINAVEIAKRCNVELSIGDVHLPDYPVPSGMTIDQYLIKESLKGLETRLIATFGKDSKKYQQNKPVYISRIKEELNVINSMGFPGYFLIVADFIRWAKMHKIPVGPGRGSGAGSLVAYSLNITDLDPITYDLLFERFLNPERVSMPDFDVDFCIKGRDKVIEYVADKYGKNAVSQIITYGTMSAKAVIRDVGRVLNHPYGFVDKIAKLIPFEIGMTLEKALIQEESLQKWYEQDEAVQSIIDLAKKLEGLTRNVGKHAGGVVIAPGKLTDFTPLYLESEDAQAVTQFDKDDVEKIGLVKFDFLGLKTLTIIDWTLRAINAEVELEQQIDISKIPLDCKKTFKLLKQCKTTAVFQLESRGMKELIRRLEPDQFEEIIALVALFRPGPLQSGMVDDFINRKHGKSKVEYPHPILEPILKPTYGVILYQEQVMQIAQDLAGYTLGGADLLRRAMGKKKPEEMAKQRVNFVDGAKKKGIKEELASYIFDLVEKFAGYGFNKSHSAAYALVSYQTAWLKAHYPAEFMAAVLSADIQNTDKLVIFLQECRQLKLKILPPNVNYSMYKFTVNKNSEIVYGLGAIKGAGEVALTSIIDACINNPKFENLFDFCRRVDVKKLNKRMLEALIYSGAMDELAPSRAHLTANLPAAIKFADQLKTQQQSGQGQLFDDLPYVSPINSNAKIIPMSNEELLQKERQVLGWYLSGHPLDDYLLDFNNFITSPLSNLKPNKGKMVFILGQVVQLRIMINKRNQKMAFMQISDNCSQLEVAIFADLFEKVREILQKGELLLIEGEVSHDAYSNRNRARAINIYPIDHAREIFCKKIKVILNIGSVDETVFEQSLQDLSTLFKEGNSELNVILNTGKHYIKLKSQQDLKLKASKEVLKQLKTHPLVDKVEMEFA